MAGLQETVAKQIKQHTVRQGESPHIKTGQDYSIGGKEFREHAKESITHVFLLLGASQNHQSNSYKIYPEDLVQTHCGACSCHFSLFETV